MHWHSLNNLPSYLPPLLLKSTLSSQGYAIHLTDLSRIWHQNLTASGITATARKQKCSIDPGEDSEQFQILQTKLQSALDQEPGTSLTLSATDDLTITLILSAPLPAPLPPFKWVITLTRSSDEAVATQLVTPLIHRSDLLNRQLTSLITELRAKDKIISRLADRLQVSGQDLTVIFPGTAGVRLKAKRSQVEQLAGHVKGLGPFYEESWRAREWDGDKIEREGLGNVLGDLGDADEGKEGPGEWWRELRGQGVKLGHGADERRLNGSMKSGSRSSESRDATDVDADSEDGFQTQQTPPYLQRQTSPPPATSDKNGHVATEMDQEPTSEDGDEDDLDAPPQRTQSSQHARASQRSQPPQPTAPSQISALSSHAQPSQPQSNPPPSIQPPPELDEDATDPETDTDAGKPIRETETARAEPEKPPASSTKKLGTLGGRRKKNTPPAAKPEPTQEREEKTASPTPPFVSAQKAQAPAKSKGKLGVLGGKRAAATPAAETPQLEAPGSQPAAAKKSPKGKLGAFSGRKPTSRFEPTGTREARQQPEQQTDEHHLPKVEADADDERASRPEERGEVPSAVRETSQERADKKREALKRQLDAKAKAPAKKKRKF